MQPSNNPILFNVIWMTDPDIYSCEIIKLIPHTISTKKAPLPVPMSRIAAFFGISALSIHRNKRFMLSLPNLQKEKNRSLPSDKWITLCTVFTFGLQNISRYYHISPTSLMSLNASSSFLYAASQLNKTNDINVRQTIPQNAYIISHYQAGLVQQTTMFTHETKPLQEIGHVIFTAINSLTASTNRYIVH